MAEEVAKKKVEWKKIPLDPPKDRRKYLWSVLAASPPCPVERDLKIFEEDRVREIYTYATFLILLQNSVRKTPNLL